MTPFEQIVTLPSELATKRESARPTVRSTRADRGRARQALAGLLAHGPRRSHQRSRR